MTKRGRNRILVLLGCLLVGTTAIVVASKLRQASKQQMAVEARRIGFEAAGRRDWPSALESISRSVAFDKSDLEAIVMLAEARRRVPLDDGRHLVGAMGYFTIGVELAESQGNEGPLRLQAEHGKLATEVALGQFGRATDTAKKILERKPDDPEALTRLLEIAVLRNRLLPTADSLVIRDGRTGDSWLKALRSEGDESAMRWALESLVVDPNNLEHWDRLIYALVEGDFENRQLVATSEPAQIESPLQIIENWKSSATFNESTQEVIVGQEELRTGDIEGAYERLIAFIQRDDEKSCRASKLSYRQGIISPASQREPKGQLPFYGLSDLRCLISKSKTQF